MKKRIFVCILLIACMLLTFGCGSGNEIASGGNESSGSSNVESSSAGSNGNFEWGEKEEFTELLEYKDDGVSLKLPANHDGNLFKDMGVNCMVTVDRYGADVVAYHEYDDEAPVQLKTVNGRTYEYQEIINYWGMPDWCIYVIKIAFTESRNQMEWSYYRILYTVYKEGYDSSQVEKFMETLEFAWY
ncbi:MAG: hypothetical protein IKZ81_03015 [Clostridia bacterium]|nr:hypothetical protein [Clostridia bacterium]MBR5942291.1 hypothetical protein [Clostridia bacterium]